MSTPEERAVVAAARAYVNAPPEPAHEDPEASGWSAMIQGLYYGLAAAVRALDPPPIAQRDLTWGQVPAGWEVRAPDGKWYRVEATRQTSGHDAQIVTMAGGTWSRDPAGPVTARGIDPHGAFEALGWPEVLEDGS